MMIHNFLFKKRFIILFIALLIPYFLHPFGVTELWASAWTRVLTSIEAMVGQLYLVVLVSRLVGIHISQSVEERSRH